MTDKARELLERVLAGMDRYGDIYPETLEKIRAYLAEPEQDEEPVAWIHNGEVYKAKQCRLFSSHPGEELPGQIPLYLHPAPRKPFVRLSEEEVKACEPQLGIVKTPDGAKVDGLWIYDFARAIEDALEEKNK